MHRNDGTASRCWTIEHNYLRNAWQIFCYTILCTHAHAFFNEINTTRGHKNIWNFEYSASCHFYWSIYLSFIMRPAVWMDGWVFFTDCITFYFHLRKWLYFNRLGFIWLVDYKLHSFWANQFIAFEFSSRSLQLFFKYHTMLLQLCIFESKRPTNIRNGIYFVKIISFTKQTDSAIHNVYLVVRLNHLALDNRNNIINNK